MASFQFTAEDERIINENSLSDVLTTFRATLPEDIDNFDDYIASAATDRGKAFVSWKGAVLTKV